MALELKVSKKIFNKTYLPFLNKNTSTDYQDIPTQIFFGGSSSGKSVFLAQRAVLDVVQGGRNYLVLRKVQRDCRKSVWNEVIKQIKKFKLWNKVKTNKNELAITFPNGYQINFGGLDDRERIKSITPEKGVVTDIWLEEATEFEEDDYKQLTKRLRGQSDKTKRITFSFNPIIKTHWIYQKFFDNWDESKKQYIDDRLSILKTTYKDNKFLTEDDIARLLDEDDDYYRDVYIHGNWGVLGNLIFTNWEVQDIDNKRGKHRSVNGLDFGFSSDPATLIDAEFDSRRNILYVFDEIYETGLTDPEFAEKIKKKIGNERVICDSAEPKSIKQLKNHGVNAIGAEKGPGSIETSYRWLKGVKIILHPRCTNTKQELQVHKWQEDRNGNATTKPEDKNNHAIDAIRYGTEQYWQGKPVAGAWGR